MAYLGNRPVSGDNNSFRVLDDIKTHTFSFDGSSSSVVSTSDNTITHLGHRLIQGQRVTYTDGTGSPIGGLTDATVYFVIMNDANSFKLASSASNAAAGTGINLTSVGSGTAHNITVAFDGVNTKFKATFNNGTEADVTRVAQIQISLNNVIQQPQNTATPTSGFGFDSDSVIVFATAPASNATFWGVLFANNFPTFEISDNDVDNFTGDGSKTEFSLSKSPATNENIIVTIDGVVQYPSDSSTTRAYNTVGNALQFSAAPEDGADIQARHIGFAGPDPSVAGVTAFYGRTGSVFLNNSDNIVVNDAEVTGNLTVQGTMTTLDTKVTEVDQLEVAANNTTVGVAITQSGSGDILNLYDGSTETFSVEDGGDIISKGQYFKIENSASPEIQLIDTSTNNSLCFIRNSSGNLRLAADNNNVHSPTSLMFLVDGSEAMRVKDGNLGINSTAPTSKLDLIGDVKITGIMTASSFVGALPITNDADNRIITASGSGGLNAEGGLLYDGTYFTHTGSGYKQLTASTTTNNSVQLKLQNQVKNFTITNVAGGVFQIAEGSTSRFKLQDGVSFLDSTVGVGTNTLTNFANSQVNIEGTAALTNHSQTLIIRDSVADNATGRGGNIGFGAYVDGTMRTLAAIGGLKKNDGTGFDGHLALYTRRHAIGPVDEVMRLESGGNVGIGTDNPDGKLHLFAETGDCVLTLEADRGNSNSTENDNPYIVFKQDGSVSNSAIGMNPNGINGESNSLVLVNGAGSGGIIFKTGSGGSINSGTSEKMRITPDGEIRIADGGKITVNTDVSGNYAVQEALRIDDANTTTDRALQIFEHHNNGSRWHSFNQNLDVTTTGSSYTYTQGNFGGSNMIEMLNGNLQIYSDEQVVGGGTSAITPTERIRLRSDGKVLIGSTLGADPYNDRKLTINSTSNTYLSIQSGDSSFSGIVFGHASGQSTDNFLSYVRHNNADNSFNIHTNSGSTPKVTITSAGRVAVGTDTIPTQGLFFVGVQTSSNNYASQPTVRFAIEGASSPHGDASAVHIGQRAGGSSDPAIIFHRRSGDVAWKSWGARIHQGGLDSFRFSFAPAALPGFHSFTDEMIIKRAVGVGIGSIPDERLHVVVSSSTATVAKFERSHNNNVSIEYKNTTSRMYAGLAGDALGWAVDNDANLGNLPMFMVRRTTGFVGVGVVEPLRKLDVLGSGSDGISILARPSTQEVNSAGNASSVNNSIIIRMPYGENPATTSNAGARFGIQFTGSNNTTDHTSLDWGDDPIKSASIYGVSEDNLGYSRKVGMAFYTSAFDATQTERLRIKNDGNVGIGTNNPGRLLTLFGNDQPVFQITNNTSGTANTRGSIFYQMSGTTTLAIDNQGGGSGGNIHFMSAGTNTFQITSGGLVRTMVRSAEERRMILSGSPTNSAFNIEAHDGESGTSSGNVQGKLGLFYNDGSTLTNTANISFERGSGASDGAMAFITNQTERLRILANGNIGVGTDTAPHRLSVKGTISMISGASGTQIVNITQDGSNNGNIIINDSSGTTRIKLDSSDVSYIRGGNVGIGTVAPERKLDVIGDVGIEGELFLGEQTAGAIGKLAAPNGNVDIYADGTIDFIESDNNKTMVTFDINTTHDDARIYLEGDQDTFFNHPNNNQLGFTIGGVDTLRLRQGEVGIGTDDPDAPLHVETAVNKSTIAIFGSTDTTSAATFQALHIKNDVTSHPALANVSSTDVLDLRSAGSVQVTIDDNNNDTSKYFRVTANGTGTSGTELFRVDEDGNVGIGTNDPGSKLDILGGGIQLRNSNELKLLNAANSASTKIFCDGGARIHLQSYNQSVATFEEGVGVTFFSGSGTPRFSVGSTGLTTLKNFNGTGLKLEGSGSDYQGMQLKVTDASASQTRNVFIDTVNETGAAVANQVGQIQSDGGSHWSWSTQTAGNRNDRRVERVRITADGELGINTNTNNTSVLSFRNSVKDHKIGGVTVVLADDTISGDITLPGERHGCLLTIFAHSDTNGTYPQPGPVGFVYVDVGASTNIRPMFTQGGTGADATTNVGNSMVGKNSHETNISNCDDGKLTIMKGSADGKMKLANRLDATYHFYLTMM